MEKKGRRGKERRREEEEEEEKKRKRRSSKKVRNYMVLYGTTWNSKVLYEFPCLYSY